MTKLEKMYQEIATNLEESMNDLEKFEEGNMSAGTRVRKIMQIIKTLAQQIRVEVQEQKNVVVA